MASEWEAIVEWFNKKAKARKAEVNTPTEPGEVRVTSIRVNGGASYGPVLMNGGGSDGTAPKKDRLLRGWFYSSQNTMECQKTNRIASKGQPS